MPSCSDSGSVVEFHLVNASKHGMNSEHFGEIDDVATMHAQELFGVETAFEAGEGFVEQVLFGATVQTDVVIRRFDPIC